MEQASMWVFRIAIIMASAMFIMIWLFMERSRNQKRVVGHTFCEIITAEGKSYKKLIRTQPNGLLIVPPTKDKKGQIFVVNKDCLYDSLYPDLPGFMRFICAEVKKVLLHEVSTIPLSNMNNVLPLTAVGLYNLEHEGFTNKGVELSQMELFEANKAMGVTHPGMAQKKGNVSWKWILIMAAITIILAVGVVVYKNWNAIMAAMGK